jgi:signal recognition particle subunit SRP54
MFESLSAGISRALDRIRMRGKLTRENIEQGMREVKSALLEADVNFRVAKDFLARVTEKAVGEAVIKSVDPFPEEDKNPPKPPAKKDGK